MHGGRSQVVKAVVCGTTIRGFKSHRPPFDKFFEKLINLGLVFFLLNFGLGNSIANEVELFTRFSKIIYGARIVSAIFSVLYLHL